jgi:hypothetical protein
LRVNAISSRADADQQNDKTEPDNPGISHEAPFAVMLRPRVIGTSANYRRPMVFAFFAHFSLSCLIPIECSFVETPNA